MIDLIHQMKNDVSIYKELPKEKYYSTAKPYYRFEMNTLEDEIKSAGWTDKKLLIDIKADGLRLTAGKVNGKVYIKVDPESLKEKSPDVTKRLPQISNELQNSLPDNTILDGEFIAVKDNEVLHRTTANSLLNATTFSPKKLTKYAYLFVFDIMFFRGKDLRPQPLKERLEFFQQLKSTEHVWYERISKSLDDKSDAYIIQGSNIEGIQKVIDKILNNKISRPKYIAEGTMIKTLVHQYQTPQNKGWGKLKKFYEVDGRVIEKSPVKDTKGVYYYSLGIDVPKEYYSKLPKKIQSSNYTCMKYGKTSNTKVDMKEGDILRIASEEVNKYENNGYPYYKGYVNRVLEEVPEKDKTDSLEVLEKLSKFQPKRVPIKEISRIDNQHPTTQEDVISPSGSVDEEPRENPPGEEVLQSINKSYKYPIDMASLIKLAEATSKEVLEWVEKKRIPKKIYDELAEPLKPLPSKLYVDYKKGEAILQMHFRGIEEDKFKAVKNKEMPLWKALVGQSVHMDFRITYPELDKMVQFVITENDIQSMVRMLKGDKRKTKGGIMNVQHSLVVSKPSGEPPIGPDRFYKSEDVESESSKPEEYSPSVDEEGAKLAESLDIGNPLKEDRSFWMEPGEVGATKNTYSYMMLIWIGDVETGCERHDLHELFLTTNESKEDIFEGRFIIKCLQGPENKRWEIWKAISEKGKKPMDPIKHSDIGYHYLVPAEKVDDIGREVFREMSQKRYKSKLS
jgi:hypothetical protein